jgi:hypothetical protein
MHHAQPYEWITPLRVLLVAITVTCGSATSLHGATPPDGRPSQEPQQKAVAAPAITVGRIASAPSLDDFVNGRPTPGMTEITGFRQREPRDGEPVSRETRAWIAYDDRQFHVVFLCKETLGAVRGRLARREDVNEDDIVGVLLDTFHDRRHAYLFIVNPVGVQLDGISTEGQDDDYSFDTLWYSEARSLPDGYLARISVPFRSLRFGNADVQEWGFGVARVIRSRNETSFWPYVTRKVQNHVEQLATLTGIEGVSPGRNIQVIPYAAGTASRYLDEDAAVRGRTEEGRVGLDAKVVLKDALTLDLAANPDFSQVESDEPQVTINQRFEVQFPEKRPFFIENASYFRTPEQLFFSRRIADPRLGTRLTGRVGKWTVAGLVMDDRAPGEQAPPGSEARGTMAITAAGRVVREFGRQSTIGAMVTSRDFSTSSNSVAAADLRLRLGPNWVIDGQAMTSRTTRLDGERLAGPAYTAQAAYLSRSLNFVSEYTDRSPGFRTDLGFITRSDVREWENEIGYTWFPKGGALLSWGPGFEASVNWDREGRVQDWRLNPEVELEFPRSTNVFVGLDWTYERFAGIGFDKRGVFGHFDTEWLKWLSVSLGFSRGRGINYYPAAGLPPFLAEGSEVEAGVTLRPLPGFRIEQAYIHNRLDTGSFSPAGLPGTGNIFRLHLLRTKGTYQFTREFSLRAILDYNGLTPSPALVALDRDRRLTGDLLLTYLVNPGTALYVGYTDAYANVRIDPTLPPVLARTEGARTSVGRQVFVKVSYLLRY